MISQRHADLLDRMMPKHTALYMVETHLNYGHTSLSISQLGTNENSFYQQDEQKDNLQKYLDAYMSSQGFNIVAMHMRYRKDMSQEDAKVFILYNLAKLDTPHIKGHSVGLKDGSQENYIVTLEFRW